MKKTISIILAILMIVGTMPFALAVEEEAGTDIIDATNMTADELEDAVNAALAAGYTAISVNLVEDAESDMFTAITAPLAADGIEEGSIDLTISGATTVPDRTFAAYEDMNENYRDCEVLRSVTLTDATTIGEGAFVQCQNMTYFSAPKAITIAYNAFSGCYKLIKVNLPSARTIGLLAFASCGALKEVSLPECTSIGDSAFISCFKMETIYAPKVTTIGSYAFQGCEIALKTLTLGAVTSVNHNRYGIFHENNENNMKKIDLFLSCEQKAMTLNNSTKYWTATGEAFDFDSTNNFIGYTFKSVTPAHTAEADDGDCTTAVKCANCGETAIEAKESHISENPENKATCQKKATCDLCGTEYGDKDTLNHKDTLVQVDAKAPTCTEIGYDTYEYCTGCDYTTYVEKAKLGHDIVIDKAVAPTCTKTGLTEGQHCTRCDDKTVAQEVVPALNHKGTLVQVEAKAKTCTTVGWEAYEYCTECDYTTKVVIPASHELQEVKAKAPTCEAIGWDAYKHCTECDYTTYVEKAKLGHDIIIDEAKAATCTATGLTEGSHCSRCDDKTVEQDVIPKKGHTEIKGGTEGAHTICDVCEDVLSAEHEFASKITTEPTYTKEGIKTFTCECGYSYEEVIPCLVPGEIKAEEAESNSFSATVVDINSIVTKLQLTEEEKALIEQGADMKIVFKLSDIGATINTPEKEAIFKALTNEKIAVFLDIQLVKQIANSSVNVQKLNGLIKVTVELPSEFINKAGNIKRSYSVLRYHDGDETKVTTLNAKFDEATGTLTFDTDRFSTYAIVYSDVVVSNGEGAPGTLDPGDGEVSTPETPKEETTPGTPETPKDETIPGTPETPKDEATPGTPETPKDDVSSDKNDDSVTNDKNDASSETGTNDKNDTSKDDVPKAGVISTTSIWLGAMALSGFGALIVSKKKKEND